jgi:mono/diheme cytochrome c family protein
VAAISCTIGPFAVHTARRQKIRERGEIMQNATKTALAVTSMLVLFAVTGGRATARTAAPAVHFAEVEPIFVANCVECHHAGKPIDLTTPPSAKLTDKILTVAAAAGPMPPAPRDHLTAADLAQIQAWKAGGYLP